MSAIFSRYCICGGSLSGSASPESAAAGVVEIWERAHSGDGHAPSDAKGAAAARRREERRWLREIEEAAS